MKKIIEYLKTNKYIQFALRHTTWILGIIIGLSVLVEVPNLYKFIVFTTVMESVAIGLSGLALYSYTHLDFTKKITYGDDGVAQSTEIYAFQKVIATIFLSVHILVGLCSLIIYSDIF